MSADKKGEGDTKWLLSLSDFYLQLIILFLMMFIVSNVDKAKTAAMVAGIQKKKGITEKSPKVLNKYPTKNFIPLILEKAPALKKGYLKEVKTPTKNIKISYEVLEGGVKLKLENLQLFNTGEDTLLDEAKLILKELIKELSGYYNVVEIIGYTSAFYEDSIDGDHFLLGYKRAQSVYKFFEVNSSDFLPSQYRLSSGGNNNLIIDIPDIVAQKINQRVEFLITPELIQVK